MIASIVGSLLGVVGLSGFVLLVYRFLARIRQLEMERDQYALNLDAARREIETIKQGFAKERRDLIDARETWRRKALGVGQGK
jgi:hypothetical protein